MLVPTSHAPKRAVSRNFDGPQARSFPLQNVEIFLRCLKKSFNNRSDLFESLAFRFPWCHFYQDLNAAGSQSLVYGRRSK